jgi:hypothetical protein
MKLTYTTLCLSLSMALLLPTAGLATPLAPASQTAATTLTARAPQSARAAPLVGAWQATGGDQERLEFRADGTLVFGGGELRYSTRGNRLVLEGDGGRVEGTWRITGGELTLTLRGGDGESQSERYRRVDPAEAREAVGRASFALPKGWTIANRDGDLAVVNPGFAEADTLDALIVVGSETLEGADLTRTVTALLETNLPALGVHLGDLQVEVEVRSAKVRALALPKLAGAEVTLVGLSGGERPVTVWVGTTRNETAAASVLVVVLRGKEDVYLPRARRILESLGFTAETATPASPQSGLAGLEFGSSTFGSDSSLTTVYRFGAHGAVTRRTMFSSPFGGSDSEAHGSYTQSGDGVTIRVDGETFEATLERRAGEPSALRIGNAIHRRV